MLTLGVEVLYKAPELLLVQEAVLVHMVLDRLHVGQEILEGHKLWESDSACLQVLQLSLDSGNVLCELREWHKNEETPRKVLSTDRVSLVITLILTEIVMPELLSDYAPQLFVFLLSNCGFPIKYLFSNL